MKFKFHFISIFLFTLSCVEESDVAQNGLGPDADEASGYVIPKDSIKDPLIILIDESKLEKIPVGDPEKIMSNTNVHPAGIPTVIIAGSPKVNIPGLDTFQLPKPVELIDSPFVAGIPEMVIVNDAYIKDQNPENFSSFSKLQGLKHDVISSILEDKAGNLWFGTYGGVSKYDGKSVTHFTEKEGLGNNIIKCMLEDKNGNLWFGTYLGVSKYDGKSFTHFTVKEGLSDNAVLSMAEDKNGILWFGTGNGLNKYDGNSITCYTEKEGLSNNAVLSILEDKNGILWFGTAGGGVSKFDGKSFINYTEKEGLCHNVVISILEDKAGNIWFGTSGGGVSKFDGKLFTNYSEKEGLSNSVILSMLEDRNGNIWFGTFNGLNKFDGKSFTHFSESQGMTANVIFAICEDKSGNIWIGTGGGGVSKYGGKTFTHFTEKEGLKDKNIFSVLKDKSGQVLLGTYGGFSKYDGESFLHYYSNFFNSPVLSMLEDKNGNIWLGTANDGILKYDGSSITNMFRDEGIEANGVRCMMEDKNGNLWFGNGNRASKYDGKSTTHFSYENGMGNELVLYMLEDKNGSLWFGTYGGGIIKYDSSDSLNATDEVFTHFTEKEGLINNTVWSIAEDSNGNLWFGTDAGVSLFNGKTFTHFTEKDGLSNNSVLAILEDKNGNLWFGSRFGMTKLSPENKERLIFSSDDKLSKETSVKVFFQTYTYEDGFLGIGANGGQTICEDNNGTIWIAANDRLTAYHTDGDIADTIPPNIQLTGIKLFNENIAWQNFENKKDTSFLLGNGVGISEFNFDKISKWYPIPENLSLSYDNNYLTFNFIGITMNQPKKVKYQYKLEGMDQNWSAITNHTEATYGNLPHGNYTFKAKAMNSSGFWSNEFHYQFSIRPPWWKTWWFRTLIGAVILFSLFGFYRWRTASLRARQKQLQKTVEERTHEAVTEKVEAQKQRKIAEEQKELVQEKHKEITDSINYAERIQRSFLATKNLLDENLKDYFVYFQPKDVVSGDFYWATKLNDGKFVLVTADSTGHGVPGAIMSIANIACLKEAVTLGITKPDLLLNETRKLIIDYLKNDGSAEGGKDGMDCSMVCFDIQNKKLNYAAANNPIWIVRKKAFATDPLMREILEFAPDKMPVGKHDKQNLSFKSNHVDLETGDVVYTLTDGFPDQFGGEKGKKFMYKKLKEFLISISSDPMEIQKQKLNESFVNWKGNLEQVDDVCVIGVRV